MNSSKQLTDSASDEAYLSLGLSVNVNEDLRRTIRSEVEDIECTIETIQNNFKNEDLTGLQLNRDLKHAKTEVSSLKRVAFDVLDSTIVGSELRKRMVEQLESEVIHLITPTSSPENGLYNKSKSGSGREIEHEISIVNKTGDGTLSISSKDYPLEDNGTGSFINFSRNENELRHVASQIDSSKTELLSYQTRKADIEKSIAVIVMRIDDEDLAGKKEESKKELDQILRDSELENQKLWEAQESVQRTRKRCGDYAQKIAEKSKQITFDRERNMSHELALNISIASKEDEISQLRSNSLAKARSEKKSTQILQGDLLRQIAKIEEWRKTRKCVQAKIRVTSERVKELSEIEALSKCKTNDSTKRVDTAKELLHRSYKDRHVVSDLKSANDTVEEQEIRPALAEQIELAKEKERLALMITDLHNESALQGENDKATLLKKKNCFEQMQCEAKMKHKELTCKVSEKEEDVRRCMEQIKMSQTEFESLKSMEKQFLEAARAETKHHESMIKQREEDLARQVIQIRLCNETERHALDLKVSILEMGANLLELTQKKEQFLREAPIDIHHDGKDYICHEGGIEKEGSAKIQHKGQIGKYDNDIFLGQIGTPTGEPETNACENEDDARKKSKEMATAVAIHSSRISRIPPKLSSLRVGAEINESLVVRGKITHNKKDEVFGRQQKLRDSCKNESGALVANGDAEQTIATEFMGTPPSSPFPKKQVNNYTPNGEPHEVIQNRCNTFSEEQTSKTADDFKSLNKASCSLDCGPEKNCGMGTPPSSPSLDIQSSAVPTSNKGSSKTRKNKNARKIVPKQPLRRSRRHI